MVELLNTIARLWWGWTASMFWQVGLLILLIGCIDLLIRKWAWPQLRYALWSLILVKLILPPSLSLPSSIVPELRPRVAQTLQWLNSERPAARENPAAISLLEDMFSISATKPTLAARLSASGGIVKIEDLGDGSPLAAENHRQASLDDATHQSGDVPSSALRPPSSVSVIWQVYAMMIWLLGTLILGIWLFLRLHSVAGRHAYRAAAASLPQSFYNHLADCGMRLGLRRIPQIAVTKRLTSPAVFGVFRPVLLVPKGYLSKLSRRDTEHMLLHELAHIKRGDLVMHGLYMLLQIVYWYNPLLWLVRQQVHHLRELSCDGTVAELLRERTLAYRQTLLETARRLLATSAEPGLGLLGLFEDSNRLLVRLNWLTKPTWRYKTMKRAIVATIAALMFACVLPMAQARESASQERKPTVVREEDQQSQDQVSQDITSLQARLEELKAQERQLQEQLRTLAEQRNQVRASGESPRESRQRAGARPRRERAPGELEIAPPEAPTAPGTRERVPPEARQQLRRAQEQVEQARNNAEKAPQAARARAKTMHAKVQEQQQWAKQMEQWENSEDVQKWQRDMEKWGEQMGRWGQELARRQTGEADRSADHAEIPAMAPMPPMPPMPAMPPAPAVVDVTVPTAPHPTPMPHVAGGGAPRIEMPRITPPVPPGIPEKEEDQEEVVSRTEHTIDLAPGRLLEVKNEMGSIMVRGSKEPGCRLVVTVKGRAETKDQAQAIVDQVKPVIKPSENGVYITTTKPEKENNNERVNRVVTMEIVVPHDAQIKLGQAFGDIRLTGLNGSIQAVSNMGSIRATEVSGRVALESNFGAIDFIVPKGFSAKVQAKSQMGSIQSDLPLETAKSDGFSMGSKASGTIGTGEGDVSLSTNMGSIRIRSQSAEPRRAESDRREPRSEPRPEPRAREEF